MSSAKSGSGAGPAARSASASRSGRPRRTACAPAGSSSGWTMTNAGRPWLITRTCSWRATASRARRGIRTSSALIVVIRRFYRSRTETYGTVRLCTRPCAEPDRDRPALLQDRISRWVRLLLGWRAMDALYLGEFCRSAVGCVRLAGHRDARGIVAWELAAVRDRHIGDTPYLSAFELLSGQVAARQLGRASRMCSNRIVLIGIVAGSALAATVTTYGDGHWFPRLSHAG